MAKEKKETAVPEEIKPEYKNGILQWKTEKGILGGLERADFLPEKGKGMSAETKQEALRQFFLYMVTCKAERASVFQAKADALMESSKEYAQKAENVGKELSEEDKLKARKARLLKQLEMLTKNAEAQDIKL